MEIGESLLQINIFLAYLHLHFYKQTLTYTLADPLKEGTQSYYPTSVPEEDEQFSSVSNTYLITLCRQQFVLLYFN